MTFKSLFLGILLLPISAFAEDEQPNDILIVEGKEPRPMRPEMRPKVPDYSLQTQRFDFPTGLRIYMQSDKTHPIVSVFSVVDHGHSDDAEGAEGSAHFAEHLWFRSSHENFGEEFSDKPVMSILNDIGAQMNATTHADWTDYRTVASKEFLPLMLKMESARLTAPYRNVTAAEIPTEREVIRNEWRRRNEQSQALLWDYLLEAVFPEGHPYKGRSTHESLDNITLPVLQKYFDDYYKADQTTIMVIGDFEPSMASSLIFENFDPKLLHEGLTDDDLFFCPRPGIEKPSRDNPDHWMTCATQPGSKGKVGFQFAGEPTPRVTQDRLPIPDVSSKEPIYRKGALADGVKKTVAVGWPMPGGFRNDDFVNSVAANMVGNAIFQGYAMQEDLKDKIQFGGCGYQPFKHHGLGLCVVDVKSSKVNPEDVAEKMLDQLSLLVLNQQAGTDAAQFERASWNRIQQESLAQTIMGIDTVVAVFGGRGEAIGMHAHYTGRGSVYSDNMTNIMQMQYDEAKAAALELFRRDKATTLIVEPLDDDEIDTTGENSSYEGASQGDTLMAGGDYYAKLSADEIASAYQSPDMTKLEEFYLANGVRVVLMPHSQAPIVQANLLLGGGNQFGPYGLHSFANRFSDWEEEDVLKVAGTQVFVGTGTEFGVGYRVPAGNLDGAFWFLREYVEGIKPDTAGKFSWMRSQRSGVRSSWSSQSWHQSRALNTHLYGDHYVGHTRSFEDVQEWENWGQDQIRSYLNARVHPDNATLIVVGNLDVAEARDLAVKYFSGWEGRADVVKEGLKDLSAPPMPSGKKVFIYDSPKKTQTQTNQTCRLNYESDADRHAISVLSELVFTRVFSQLRIKEGLAYSPGGYAQSRDKYGLMGFSSLAVNSGVGRTLEFFDEAIREMENGEFDEGILNQAKLRKSRGDGVSGQSTGQMMSKLTAVVANERDWSAVRDMGKDYAAVTKEHLQRLTKGCAENSIVTLLGPKDIIIPQLEEKGIEYEVVDWETAGDEILAKYDPKAAKKKAKKKAKADAKKAKKEAKEKAKAEASGAAAEDESAAETEEAKPASE